MAERAGPIQSGDPQGAFVSATATQTSMKHNVAWMFFGQGSAYALRVVYFIMIARLLGPLQYGIVVGAFAFVNLAANYSRLGTGMVLLRYVSADHRNFAVYWGNVLLVTFAVSGVLVVLLRLAAPFAIGPPGTQIVLMTAIAICLFEQVTISATQVFQAFQQMRVTAFLNLLTSLLRAIAAGGMFLLLRKATAFQWSMASLVVSFVAAIIGVAAVTSKFGLPRFVPRLALQRAAEGFEYAFSSSTSSAYDDLDKTMLSHYGMNAANGIYTMAYRLIDMATMPVTSIQLAAEPRLFALGASGLRESLHLGKRLLLRSAGVSLLLAAVLYLGAPLLPYIAGKAFSEGIFALRWLCLIPVFRSIHKITGSVLTCAGMQRARTITQVTAALMNFGLNLWLIPRFGWRGAAWASLATDGGLGLLNWVVLMVITEKGMKAPISSTIKLDAGTGN